MEISVGQEEESKREKWRTQCGFESLQSEYLIGRLLFSRSNRHARKVPAFRLSE